MKLNDYAAIHDLIRELSAEISHVYRLLAERAGLNQTDLMSLYFINRATNGTATPKLLAQHLGLTSGATAILLNRLEARGFVTRSPHPTDRRAVLLSMGEAAGEHAFMELRKKLLGLNAEVIQDLSPEEAAVVRRFIDRVVANTRETLQQFRQETPAAGLTDDA